MSTEEQAKRRAAIMAAVAAYIEEEERARLAVGAQRRQVPMVNLWHLFGREEIMRMRMLWQRRIVSK
jgi:hypothetical protein